MVNYDQTSTLIFKYNYSKIESNMIFNITALRESDREDMLKQ